ncbi:MAG: hypothetical protein AB6733_20180 [Clostridiaceae bacterium]
MMKSFNNFKEYNKKSCIKTNIITSSIFIAIALISFILFYTIVSFSSEVVNKSNGFGDLAIIAFGILIINFILVVITILAPLFISIYKEYIDNLKALSGLWICNLIFGFFMNYISTYFVKLILLGVVISLGALTLKYIYIKRKINN